jgi:hypothetical protein
MSGPRRNVLDFLAYSRREEEAYCCYVTTTNEEDAKKTAFRRREPTLGTRPNIKDTLT